MDSEKNINIESNGGEKKKKKNILLIIFVLISILESIVTIVASIVASMREFGLALFFPLFWIPIRLLVIWTFYFIIVFGKYLYRKKKSYAILFLILLIILLNIEPIWYRINPKKNNLSEIFDTSGGYLNTGKYLINNNRLYYSIFKGNDSEIIQYIFPYTTYYKLIVSDTLQNSLNSMNIDETDNKVLCNNFKSSDGNFLFMKDNELYYDFGNNVGGLKKINLSNCKEKVLMSDDYKYIDNTIDGNYIYMYHRVSERGGERPISIIKLDISNNKKVEERKFKSDIPVILGDMKYVIDYDHFDIYYESSYIPDNLDDYSYEIIPQAIYKNEEIIYKPVLGTKHMDVLFLDSNYLFLYSENVIYQLDLTINSVINNFDNKFNNISRIFSDTNDNYFVADGKIYQFDNTKKEFVSVLNLPNIDDKYNVVHHYGDKLVFDNDHEYSSNRKVLIYDVKTKDLKEYTNILYDYDGTTLYVISYDGNIIKIDEIK